MIHSPSPVLRRLRQAALGAHGGHLSDGQLLRAFLNDRDESAFEALVRRHGSMVLGVCRRVLPNVDDAEDAFQAAFLVLVRKAAGLAGREIIGDWLHGVAHRTALKARTVQARRRGKERRMARPEAVEPDVAPEWQALLDQELQGLPEKYRTPIILCELEGRTHQEAARQLGCPVGTLSGRLSRARGLLAGRLRRRGLTLSAAALSAALGSQAATAGIPKSLIGSTVKAATLIAAGRAAAGAISAQVAALTEGVVRSMLLSKLKVLGFAVLAVAFLGLGVGTLRPTAAADEDGPYSKPELPTAIKPPPKVPEAIPERLFEIAFRIAELKNGERKIISEPRIRNRDGKTGIVRLGAEKVVRLRDGITFISSGLTVQAAVSSNKEGGLAIELSASRDTIEDGPGNRGTLVSSESARFLDEIILDKSISLELKSKDQNAPVIQITATVSEVPHERTIESAEKDFNTAEFYRRSKNFASARFMYQLVLRRYPKTLYAAQAEKRIAELPEFAMPPLRRGAHRVGEVRIINNTKIEDSVIRENLRLYSGSSFTSAELREAEKELAQRVKSAKPLKVSIGYAQGEGDYWDVVVRVEE